VLIGLVVRWLFFSASAGTIRDLFRQWPEARASFVGSGRWIGFSRRFGLRYAIPMLIAPFVWVVIAAKLVPDTDVGAWLIFGPAIAALAGGVILGGLVVMRWMVGGR